MAIESGEGGLVGKNEKERKRFTFRGLVLLAFLGKRWSLKGLCI